MTDAIANEKPLIKRLVIVGVGLIGGSLARALRASGAVEEIVGCGRNVGNLERAIELGVIDRFETDPALAVVGADMVFLAVPLGAMQRVMLSIKDSLPADAVITDGGSAKHSVVTDAIAAWGKLPAQFVPGHPIAGRELGGVEASTADLYQSRRIILTPLGETDTDATAKVSAMWAATGAVVTTMSVEHHDEVLAATSHLPHVLAYQLVNTLAGLDDRIDIFRYAAGGFRDFTRIASSDPVMWRDIALANSDALLAVLDQYSTDLNALRERISAGDAAGLESMFFDAKQARDAYVDSIEQGDRPVTALSSDIANNS